MLVRTLYSLLHGGALIAWFASLGAALILSQDEIGPDGSPAPDGIKLLPAGLLPWLGVIIGIQALPLLLARVWLLVLLLEAVSFVAGFFVLGKFLRLAFWEEAEGPAAVRMNGTGIRTLLGLGGGADYPPKAKGKSVGLRPAGYAGSASDGAGYPDSAESPSSYGYPHPYHKLGGWLLFIVVTDILSIAYLLLCEIFLLYLGKELGVGLTAGISVLLLGGCALRGMLVYKIMKKDHGFLRYFELLLWFAGAFCIVITVAAGIFIDSLTGALYSQFGLPRVLGLAPLAIELIGGLLGIAISYAIYGNYFARSVRVRTYMGSEKYLRRSILFNKTPSPAPADREPPSP
jgi:hypothetical protein